MIQSFLSRKFAAFLLVRGTAATVNFGSRILYDRWVNFDVAVLLAFVGGLVTAFTLNKLFIFKNSDHSVKRSAIYFLIVNLAALLQTWGVTMALAFYVLPAMGIESFVEDIAHGVGIGVPVFTSFIAHNHWTFKSTATLDGYTEEPERT